MSRTPLLQQLLRDRQLAPLRHAGRADRTRVLQHDHGIGGDVEVFAVDARRHVGVVLEHDGRSAMLQQVRFHRGRLDDRAIRREVAGQHREAVAFATSGLSRLRITSSSKISAPAMFSPSVEPFTVICVPSISSPSSTSNARKPPA